MVGLISFVPVPTVEPDAGPDHPWLQFPNDRVGAYNTYDVVMTALARRELPTLLKQSGNADYFARWFRDLVPVALNIQRRGFGHLDRGRQAELKRKIAGELDGLEGKLLAEVRLFDEMRAAAEQWRVDHYAKDLADATAKNAKRKKPRPEPKLTREKARETGYASRVRKAHEARESFLNSPQAKADWLFGTLGLKPAPKAHKRPARSVGQHALMHIYRNLRKMDEKWKWVIEDLFHRSRLNTIRTRYLDPPTGPDDRIYPHVRVYAAETLRWAYSNPALHQWVPEIRHLIVAGSGKVFVAADVKQFEARIMAYYAGEEKDIAAFEDPTRDVHAETARDLFRLSPAEWDALDPAIRKKQRDFAKTKRYEIGYGGSGLGNAAKVFCPCPRCAAKVPQMLSLAPAEQRTIMKRWEASRGKTMRWREETYRQVIANGKRWTSPFGYTRTFFRPADDIRTELANYPMQHTAAELINRSVVELDRLGAPVVLQMHDELVLECPVAEVDHWKKTLQEVMETPVPEFGGVIFPVDVHVAEDWGGLK